MSEKSETYRLDRTAFSAQTFEAAANQTAFWISKTPAERLSAAWYLICAAWNLDIQLEHRLDRTQFSMRKRG